MVGGSERMFPYVSSGTWVKPEVNNNSKQNYYEDEWQRLTNLMKWSWDEETTEK